MVNGFGKWGCLLYLVGCVAIFMLFGTKEWMMTYEAKMFNQSVQPDAKRNYCRIISGLSGFLCFCL